jgi:hypothetical protein
MRVCGTPRQEEGPVGVRHVHVVVDGVSDVLTDKSRESLRAYITNNIRVLVRHSLAYPCAAGPHGSHRNDLRRAVSLERAHNRHRCIATSFEATPIGLVESVISANDFRASVDCEPRDELTPHSHTTRAPASPGGPLTLLLCDAPSGSRGSPGGSTNPELRTGYGRNNFQGLEFLSICVLTISCVRAF